MLLPLGLNAQQMVVATTVLSLHFPYVATFAVLAKELGDRRYGKIHGGDAGNGSPGRWSHAMGFDRMRFNEKEDRGDADFLEIIGVDRCVAERDACHNFRRYCETGQPGE